MKMLGRYCVEFGGPNMSRVARSKPEIISNRKRRGFMLDLYRGWRGPL
jgi:hypothetical protein